MSPRCDTSLARANSRIGKEILIEDPGTDARRPHSKLLGTIRSTLQHATHGSEESIALEMAGAERVAVL